MTAGRGEVVRGEVEGRSRGLVKPHTFFEVDDEGVDGRAADEAAGLAVHAASYWLLCLAAVAVEFTIFIQFIKNH